MSQVNVRRAQNWAVPGRAVRFAWKWSYSAVGPDGAQFDNDSVVTLRAVLRRRYGRAIVIKEEWNGE